LVTDLGSAMKKFRIRIWNINSGSPTLPVRRVVGNVIGKKYPTDYYFNDLLPTLDS
jgi:hypothetical protein